MNNTTLKSQQVKAQDFHNFEIGSINEALGVLYACGVSTTQASYNETHPKPAGKYADHYLLPPFTLAYTRADGTVWSETFDLFVGRDGTTIAELHDGEGRRVWTSYTYGFIDNIIKRINNEYTSWGEVIATKVDLGDGDFEFEYEDAPEEQVDAGLPDVRFAMKASYDKYCKYYGVADCTFPEILPEIKPDILPEIKPEILPEIKPMTAPKSKLKEGQVAALAPKGWDDLRREKIADVRWLVKEFLPPGVSLLIGRPKIGKSWLAMLLAIHIAAGRNVFGRRVSRSKCLYLGLEDSDKRLQDRISQLLEGFGIKNSEVNGKLTTLLECARLGAGLEEQLIELLKRDPTLRLIIIDVLAKVRAGRKANQSVFDYDYGVGDALKKITAQFPELSIILVHHAAKGATDSAEAVSGTLGLPAGVDNSYTMMPGSEGVELHIDSRDVSDDDFIPMIKAPHKVWTMESRESAKSAQRSSSRNAIISAVAAGCSSPHEIMAAASLTKATVDNQLPRMVRKGELVKAGRGHYTVPSTSATGPRIVPIDDKPTDET